MLFASMLFAILGYSMVYAAFHGDWAFWRYWFPKTSVNVNG
jgi:hypothetical protein